MSRHLAIAAVALAFSGCSRDVSVPAQELVGPAQTQEFVSPAPKVAQLETNSFRLSMPSDWAITSLKPAIITGPGGERVEVSSFAIQGSGNHDDLESVLQEVVQNSREAMRAAAADPQLRIAKDLTESRTKSHDILIEMHCETMDASTLFLQFAIVGPRTVVLATIEVEKEHTPSVDVLRSAVENIEWINE